VNFFFMVDSAFPRLPHLPEARISCACAHCSRLMIAG